ncbi:prepilin-type N-terminal cleavage/methylation domain-containing protein [Mucilaginibacter sp. 14171R-50]|uniref:PulJ/GspJ family protein n=1 Tax=Mucilaginibacter sp. 14171R-50 TaxID=2703789 RepID=UPI00138C3521|nr:prepilin-type N-terminal cleavage/methylation domain-containing protein [Mucilaginibacter sp. 14171R-50]QHS56501.1 prepilin-type N-terminal cleavage/methylation domain-containing protein [Mucilaginibacter sp. 14171R-50]
MGNKHLKAFTLTEMIMVMLLTAIVVAMAYEVLRIVYKTHAAFAAKNERVNDVERLEHWLRRDFQKAEVILGNDHSVRLLSTGDTVSYVFADSLVIRRAVRVDSFRIATSDLVTAFRAQPVQAAGEQMPIDELTFSILLEKQQLPENFFKWYSATQLINLTNGIDRHQ